MYRLAQRTMNGVEYVRWVRPSFSSERGGQEGGFGRLLADERLAAAVPSDHWRRFRLRLSRTATTDIAPRLMAGVGDTRPSSPDSIMATLGAKPDEAHNSLVSNSCRFPVVVRGKFWNFIGHLKGKASIIGEYELADWILPITQWANNAR
jgi:hypothetical protein